MKEKRTTGYGLLLLAGLFLWNPIVGLTDILPDLIGYVLLLAGLSKIADLQEEIGEARERFRAVVWVALGETAAQFFIRFFLSATSPSGDIYGQNTPTWILLFSFVITVLECYFLIPAYRGLFHGLGRLAERKNAAHFSVKGNKSRYDRMAVFAVVFVIGKNLLSLLPECTALSIYAYYQAGTISADWYSYIRVIRLFALLPALILTGWWLARWIRLFAAARKDTPFQDSIREEYEQKILPNRGLLLGRRVRLSFLLARLGAAMLPTFLLLWEGVGDVRPHFGVELLPDFAAVIFLFASVYLLGAFERVRKSEIWIGAAALWAGIIEWILCALYYRQYSSLDALYHHATAGQSMRVLTVATIVSSALTATLFCLFLFRILRLIRTELGASERGIMKEYRVRFVFLFFLLAGITAGKIADRVLRPWTNWVWWIPILLTVAFVLVLSSVFADLSEGLAARYPSNSEKLTPAE